MYMGYMGYVKKEDAKELLARQPMMGRIFAGALAIVFVLMNVLIGPKISALASEFSYTLPWYADPTVRAIVFVAAVLVLFLVQPQSETELEAKLRKYKPGEMILMSKLTDQRYVYTVFGIMLASVLYIVLSIVLPIYSITGAV